ncbi:MAG: zinc dependent phospholipase C family protein [Bacillota bacterium]
MISYRAWEAAKKVLVLGDPIYGLVDSKGITHQFCNEQAIFILANDGFFKEAEILKKNLETVNRGACWADRGWKCLAHYLDPDTQKGLGPWPDAAQESKSYFAKALAWWQKGERTNTFFYLGALLHLIQDLCVPYHASAVPFAGHQDFEGWARKNRCVYRVKSDGIYDLAKEPEQWVYSNARIAKQFYRPDGIKDRSFLHHTVGFLLPLAQRTTTGFIRYFLTKLN